MITIQEAGREILGDNPRDLYFFCGSEYGIKVKYLSKLEEFYGNLVCFDSVSLAISTLSKKSLIARSNAVYVVRYDDDFIALLGKKGTSDLSKLKIDGTLVCIYEDDKHTKKLDKAFPDNTVLFEALPENTILSYLQSDPLYSELPSFLIKFAGTKSSNYYHAQLICDQLLHCDVNKIEATEHEWGHVLGCDCSVPEQDFRIAVLYKNLNAAIHALDNFTDDISYLLNCLCNTMVDLEKAYYRKGMNDSIVLDAAKWWKLEDIYNTYVASYTMMDTLRAGGLSTQYTRDVIVCILSLLLFKDVPVFTELRY